MMLGGKPMNDQFHAAVQNGHGAGQFRNCVIFSSGDVIDR
jgi:hypothetical protein